MPDDSAPHFLDQIRRLRGDGKHEEACEHLVTLAKLAPTDAQVLYEAASAHDYLDRETEAAAYYVAAIEAGLSGEDLKAAYLGLGSTYRILGRYEQSLRAFAQGLRHFPDAREIHVFTAMTLYNLGRFHEAMTILLRVVADTSGDAGIQSFERAIRLYAVDLDRHSASIKAR